MAPEEYNLAIFGLDMASKWQSIFIVIRSQLLTKYVLGMLLEMFHRVMTEI